MQLGDKDMDCTARRKKRCGCVRVRVHGSTSQGKTMAVNFLLVKTEKERVRRKNPFSLVPLAVHMVCSRNRSRQPSSCFASLTPVRVCVYIRKRESCETRRMYGKTRAHTESKVHASQKTSGCGRSPGAPRFAPAVASRRCTASE